MLSKRSIDSRKKITGFNRARLNLAAGKKKKSDCNIRQAINDDLDFDLNDEELDELYSDIYERLPRASKDEAWKVFSETASKCCQNVDRCLKETTYVPCLGNQMS